MEKTENPWTRLPKESAKQYEAFCLYRDMGTDRSIINVAKLWSDSRATSRLMEWSSKHQWVERATSYDEYIDEISRSGFEDEIREMAARHAQEAKLFQEKVHERLEKIDTNDLKPHELIKWYETAVKIEGLSIGVPTENIKQYNQISEVKRDEITPEKLKIPEVRKAANKFIKTIADSESSSDGTGVNSK